MKDKLQVIITREFEGSDRGVIEYKMVGDYWKWAKRNNRLHSDHAHDVIYLIDRKTETFMYYSKLKVKFNNAGLFDMKNVEFIEVVEGA